ncbi:MAG TPA: aminotransferase class IV [Polyangiaceae bacterium]
MPRADVWVDGTLVPWADAHTSVLSHAHQRGALVFDVGALREGARGPHHPWEPCHPCLFRPREHLARFLRSAALVGLDVRWDAEALLAATVGTARAAGAPSALVRWSAYTPTLEVDVVPRAGAAASVAIAVIVPEDTAPAGDAAPGKPATVRVMVSHDVRKAGPEVFPPQAKVAASYLGPMLAKRRALAAGADEVVLLDREGRVAEAPTANVFAVKDGVLVTPPLDRVLAGITRDSILALAHAEGIPAREAHLSPQELATADEAFLAATSLPVQGIATVDGRALRDGAPGPVTRRVKEALLACERGEDPRFAAWVVPVG